MYLERGRPVGYLAALLFFQSGNEFVLGGYLATFLTRELTASPATASYCLAGYWASGPRNVLIERADGTRVVRPFRGLRRPRAPG